ncbi:IS630 family transposase [Novosphingobium beihaiensis]|uniref:IS630 family transposase n=1 Tax=Novosphingobium beihaiensis TaxID=2930389 RepID=A0ABT0BU48_9SPHN|nr:IS630 family transposase [Novosphingobium beihaiensis]MCJ2188569.1 IS630 family transposase [Novosphingobium beihaiensis]
MTRPYSMDLRDRAIARVEAGESVRTVASALSISAATVVRWSQRHRQTGSPAPGKVGGHKPRLLTGALRDWLLDRTKTDFTLRGLVAELAERGVKVDYVQVWRFAHAEGLSFKKSVLPAEQLRPQIARRREQWKKYQARPDPARLVFVDETWAKTNMAPLRGWAPKGQRLHAKVPYGHWKTMTFIAALRCDRIDAPFVFDQPINAASFTAWVEEQLCPTLGPGDIVILDNLSSHKKPAVRAAIRARGARLLFLPPYSPDLNPIEQVFAKLKHLLRKAAERSVETTWRRIGSLLHAFSPAECANYLRNSGYGAA